MSWKTLKGTKKTKGTTRGAWYFQHVINIGWYWLQNYISTAAWWLNAKMTCSLWTDVMFTFFVTCETGQICSGCGYCYDCLRESIIQFKAGWILLVLFGSNCHKLMWHVLHNVSSCIFLLLHKKRILHHSKLRILCLYLPACQHSKSTHNNAVCKFHYGRDVMICANRCGEKYTYISVSVSIICKMSCKLSAYWISAKNPISCILRARIISELSLQVTSVTSQVYIQNFGNIKIVTTAALRAANQNCMNKCKWKTEC